MSPRVPVTRPAPEPPPAAPVRRISGLRRAARAGFILATLAAIPAALLLALVKDPRAEAVTAGAVLVLAMIAVAAHASDGPRGTADDDDEDGERE